MDADEMDPPLLPVLEYGRPGSARRSTSGVPSVGWWTLLAGHAVLMLVGCVFTLAAVVGLASVIDGPSTALFCGGLPALLGVGCLSVGARGLCRLGRDDDPTWGGRR